MFNQIDEQIQKYKGDDGKLTCSNAYKIAAKLKTTAKIVGQRAKDKDIRISACDLGQFGKQTMGRFENKVLDDLSNICNEQNRVYCKDARELAKKSSLKMVRSAIKKSGLDVIYCELGCFKEKKRTRLYVKTKTWIENQNRDLLFGKGKTEILELIKEYGSISQAAKKLNMSYKKAWNHIQILQKNLDNVLVQTQKGAGEQGGTTLTPKALEFIQNYKQLQDEIEEFANERFIELFLKKRGSKK
jgi:molybdate transport repressor ModE-like protein